MKITDTKEALPLTDARSQTERVAATLRQKLLRGEFRPGERLAELTLAPLLDASRTPVRLALERLAHQGLLEAQPAARADSGLLDLEYRRQIFASAAQRARVHFQETTWLAFWRTAVEGREISLVAAELGLTPGALYVARNRVMARLRQEIEQIEGGPSTG